MVQQNSAKKESITLESLVLTDDDIKKYQLSADDLYFISLEGVVTGPIFKEALKKNLELFDPKRTALIQQQGATEWTQAYSHPYFQARKLEVVGQEIEVTNETSLYLLDHHGMKAGPFQLEAIAEKVKSRSILLTDLVSIDDGKSWLKLYQIEQFDRRHIKPQGALPELPQTDIFDQSELEVVDTLGQTPAAQQTEDAIVGLAIVTNINSNKAQDKAYSEVIKDSKKKAKNTSFTSWWIPTAVAVLGLTVSAIYFSGETPRTPETTTQTNNKAVIKAPPAPTRPLEVKRTPAAKSAVLGTSKVVNRVNPPIPGATSGTKKAFKDSEAYEFHDDINENAVPADFVEGEMVMPQAQLTDEELMDLESKISNRFNITPVENSEGPASEEGLFEEETSY